MRTRFSIGTIFLVVLSLTMTGCLSGNGPNPNGNGNGGNGNGNGGNGNGNSSVQSLTVSPSSISINPTTGQPFTAKATFSDGHSQDVTAQTTWSSSDTSIATMDNLGLAQANTKPGTTTITGTFNGKSGTAKLTVIDIASIAVTADVSSTDSSVIGPAMTVSGTPLQFKATANSNDVITNLSKWTADPAVATISTTGLATAVGAGQTDVSAAFQGITGITALDVTTENFTNADLNGNFVISLTGVDSRGTWFLVGSLKADGAGNITGIVDSNNAKGVQQSQTVSGSYTVFADGRGDVSFAFNGVSHSLRFVLTASKTVAQVIEFDSATVSAGKLELQTGSGSFSASSFNGAYVFGQGGVASYSPTAPMAVIGALSSDGVSKITGLEDVNNNAVVSQNVTLTGTYTPPSATSGRFTAALSNAHSSANYVFYLVSSSKAYFMSTDSGSLNPVLGGVVESQSSTPTLANASYVFLIDYSGTGQFSTGGIGGQISLSSGTISGGEQDEGPIGPLPNLLTVTGGTYTANGGGRYVLCETISTTCDRNFILYLASSSHFYMLRTDSGVTNVQMGTGDQQSSVTVGSGTYGLRAARLDATSTAEADGGLLKVPQGACPICGIGDQDANVNGTNTISSFTLSQGTISPQDAFGRGTIKLQGPSSTQVSYIFYVVSGSKLIVIGETPNTDGTMNSQ